MGRYTSRTTMTLSNSRIPVLTTKQKQLTDDIMEGPQKSLKSSVEGLSKQTLRIITDIAPESLTLDELLSSTESENSLFDESPPQLETPDVLELCSHPVPSSPEDLRPAPV